MVVGMIMTNWDLKFMISTPWIESKSRQLMQLLRLVSEVKYDERPSKSKTVSHSKIWWTCRYLGTWEDKKSFIRKEKNEIQTKGAFIFLFTIEKNLKVFSKLYF